MAEKIAPCGTNREVLLEKYLAEGEKTTLPPEIKRHLQSCEACSNYWKGLVAVRSAFPQDPLYSPFLKAKTLNRIPVSTSQSLEFRWLPLVVLAASLSFSFTFVLPAWLMTKLFLKWTTSTAMAGGAALIILLMAGTLVTVLSAIALIHRGYIKLQDLEEFQARAGL